MFKKLSIVLFSIFTIGFSFAQTFAVNGINYNVITGTQNVEVGDNTSFSGAANITDTVSDGTTTFNVTSIGDNAFNACSGLTSIIIPNSVTSIGEEAFYYCSGLTSVIIPDSVTSIGDAAFYLCSGLSTVTIGKSVTSIGTSAFSKCFILSSLICKIKTPLTVSSIFDYVNKSTCKLTVPLASLTAYQTADVWKEFSPIVGDASLSTSENNIKNNVVLYPNPMDNEAVLELKNSENSQLEVYDTNGKIVLRKSLNNNSKNTINTSNLPKGIYLFKVGKSVTKVIKN